MLGTLRLDPRRFALDTFAGLVLFAITLLLIVAMSTPVGAVETNLIAFAGHRWLPLLLVSGIFSLILAFNLALYRHVHQSVVANRRRQRRSAVALYS